MGTLKVKLGTVYGSTTTQDGPERMEKLIGESFWKGSSCKLREEIPGELWSVWSHGDTNRAGIVVVRKGKRLQFGTPVDLEAK